MSKKNIFKEEKVFFFLNKKAPKPSFLLTSKGSQIAEEERKSLNLLWRGASYLVKVILFVRESFSTHFFFFLSDFDQVICTLLTKLITPLPFLRRCPVAIYLRISGLCWDLTISGHFISKHQPEARAAVLPEVITQEEIEVCGSRTAYVGSPGGGVWRQTHILLCSILQANPQHPFMEPCKADGVFSLLPCILGNCFQQNNSAWKCFQCYNGILCLLLQRCKKQQHNSV